MPMDFTVTTASGTVNGRVIIRYQGVVMVCQPASQGGSGTVHPPDGDDDGHYWPSFFAEPPRRLRVDLDYYVDAVPAFQMDTFLKRAARSLEQGDEVVRILDENAQEWGYVERAKL